MVPRHRAEGIGGKSSLCDRVDHNRADGVAGGGGDGIGLGVAVRDVRGASRRHRAARTRRSSEGIGVRRAEGAIPRSAHRTNVSSIGTVKGA
ncbi:MAG: hypothetical protein UY94_C0041G0007 [Parcubacteria group bacterium GW2011_GWA2_56_21]|nr:MAG: hypothetical protein UY94_C0041G0007 [Parcubacteria group bacterium GW2011_GWA2_56_21]